MSIPLFLTSMILWTYHKSLHEYDMHRMLYSKRGLLPGFSDIDIVDAAMHESVAAIAACGVSPIVRIPDNQGWMVKREYFLSG